MGSIVTGPSAAFVAQQNQQPDLIGNLGHLLQLKGLQNQLALAPLQQQEAQQRVQAGQLQLQQEQQALKDQQAFRDAGQDPNLKDKTLGGVAEYLRSKGSISLQGYQQLREADLKTRTEVQKLSDDQASALKGAYEATKPLYENIQKMDDNQIAQNWGNIASQYDAIWNPIKQSNPNGQNFPVLDPNHPMTKAQLAQYGPMLQLGQSYVDSDMARRKSAAETTAKELENQYYQTHGGAPGVSRSDADKFTSDYIQSHNLEDNPANRQKAFDVYTEKTKIKPAEVRMNAMLQLPTEVADPNNPGETIMVRRNDSIGMKGKGSASTQAIKAEDKYMTSGKGAQQLTAFNTAMQHLDVLDKLGSDLNNSNLQIVNRAKQAWAQATGNPAPANFAAAKNAMAGEVAAALKASGATDKEIEKVGDTFDRAQSPIQLKGAIATYRMLLRSKASNLQQQYQQGMQGRPNFGPPENSAPTQNSGPSSDPFAQFGGKAH